MLKFISDIAHYDIVLNLASQIKRSLWLGTADIKDLHVKRGITTMPFLGILAELVSKNVEVPAFPGGLGSLPSAETAPRTGVVSTGAF